MQKLKHNSSLIRFRKIAISEGISFLVLLFIAMPLKYLAGFPQGVFYIGWIHGLLFICYMISCMDVKLKNNWSIQKTIYAIGASLIPFGPFILDKKILRKEIN